MLGYYDSDGKYHSYQEDFDDDESYEEFLKRQAMQEDEEDEARAEMEREERREEDRRREKEREERYKEMDRRKQEVNSSVEEGEKKGWISWLLGSSSDTIVTSPSRRYTLGGEDESHEFGSSYFHSNSGDGRRVNMSGRVIIYDSNGKEVGYEQRLGYNDTVYMYDKDGKRLGIKEKSGKDNQLYVYDT